MQSVKKNLEKELLNITLCKLRLAHVEKVPQFEKRWLKDLLAVINQQ